MHCLVGTHALKSSITSICRPANSDISTPSCLPKKCQINCLSISSSRRRVAEIFHRGANEEKANQSSDVFYNSLSAMFPLVNKKPN